MRSDIENEEEKSAIHDVDAEGMEKDDDMADGILKRMVVVLVVAEGGSGWW